MKKSTLKHCAAALLVLTMGLFPMGQTASYANENTSVVEESIIEGLEENIIRDVTHEDYDMWKIPEEERSVDNFGPAFEKEVLHIDTEQNVVSTKEVKETLVEIIKPEVKETEVKIISHNEIPCEPKTSTETPIVKETMETRIEPELVMEPAEVSSINRWDISLNDNERNTLARIVKLECGGESDLGQQAVIEVIFNRVLDKNYPSSVVGVLSQRCGKYSQFSTWKNVNSKRATPTDKEYRNIDRVLNGETNVLPFKTVFFSVGAQNKRVQARIGGHTFCNRK